MGISDNMNESDTPYTSFLCENEADILNRTESNEEEGYQFSSSLEWQQAKSPFESFLFGWGNTVDGELGLGGIEDQHILVPRQIIFHDSENIKHGTYTLL